MRLPVTLCFAPLAVGALPHDEGLDDLFRQDASHHLRSQVGCESSLHGCLTLRTRR